MANIQQYRNPTIETRGVSPSEGYKVSTSVHNQGAAIGEGLSQLGAVLQKESDLNDQLRVEDAFNKLRESQLDMTFGKTDASGNRVGGYLNVDGKNALPQDDQTLSDRFTAQYKATAQALEDSLGNDRQKQLFRKFADRSGIEFKSGVMRHEGQQIDNWRKQTIDGVFSVESDNAAKNWNNPQAIDLSRGRIDINLARMRDADGTPADQIDKIRLGVMTKLHGGVIDAAIANNNLDYAAAYMKRYGNEIDAGTLLKANSIIQKQNDSNLAFTAARSTVGKFASALSPTDADRAFNITINSESGGKQFDKDGKPLTSSAGAIGIAQVMPGTAPEAAKLAGLPFDEQRYKTDAEYNRALGRAYFAKQLQTFGGNVKYAWAAYNAGPGATQAAIAKAQTEGGDWLSYLPKETQNYVTKNSRAYGSGMGAPQKPTLVDLENDLIASNPTLASRPELFKQAREQLKQHYDDIEKATKQRKEEAEGEIYKQLTANGGDFNAVPKALLANIDQEKIPAIMANAAKIKRGVPTDTNPALYQKLTTDPAYLKGLSEGQLYALRGELDQADFKHFAGEWAKLNGRTSAAAESASDLNSSAMNTTLNQRLSSLGIDPTPKDSDSAGMARVGAIRQFVTRSILDAQAQTGKKFNDADTIKHIDNLFTKSTELRNSFLGFDTSKNVALLTMKPGDVPNDARDKIKAAFKASGAPEPSDADILQVYWNQRFNPKLSVVGKAKGPKIDPKLTKSLVDQIPY